MRPSSVRISAILIVVLSMVSCIAIVPSSSAENEQYGEYGAVYDFDYAKFDNAIETATGKSVEGWASYAFSELLGYEFEMTPGLYAKLTTTRDTIQGEKVYTITDHTSGYIDAKMDATMRGGLPAPGTYERNDGESSLAFIKRVLKDESGGATGQVEFHSSSRIFMDLGIVSHIDLATGNVTDSCLTLKFAIYEITDRTMTLDYTADDEGEIRTITVSYGRVSGDSNFFTDTEVAFTITGMPVFVGDEQWSMEPVMTEHVNKLVLSSDLANSIWLKVIDMADGDKSGSKLPQLILELMGSGGRRLDLFETISSLTGKSIPDLTFTDKFDASQYADARGYHYTRLVSPRNTFDLPRSAYTLSYSELALMLPGQIISDAGKVILSLFFAAIGWDDIDVGDISDDQQMRNQCRELRAYVDRMIEEDNQESYPVPEQYIWVSAIGISVSVVVLLLMWRRIL